MPALAAVMIEDTMTLYLGLSVGTTGLGSESVIDVHRDIATDLHMGSVAWCTDWTYHELLEANSTMIISQGGRTSMIPIQNFSVQTWSKEWPQRPELISSSGAWQAHYTCLFEGRQTPPVKDFHAVRG